MADVSATKKDDKQSCDAWLTIDDVTYEGSTGQDHGHAEMDALHNFIMSDPGNQGSVKKSVAYCAKLLSSTSSKSVYCPSRPCCLKCSATLTELGFSAGKDSSFSETPMGSTEWGASNNVRALLAACGVPYDKITALS